MRATLMPPGRGGGKSVKAVAIALGLALVGSGAAAALAQAGPPAALGAGAQQWASLQQQLSALQGRQRAVLLQLAGLQQAVQEAQARLAAADAQLTRDRAAAAQARVAAVAAQAAHRAAVGQTVRLLRFMQYVGPVSPLQWLLGVKSWAGWVSRLDSLQVSVERLNHSLAVLQAAAANQQRAAQKAQALAQAAARDQAAARRAATQLAAQEAALNRQLAGLGSRRQFYQQALAELSRQWQSLAVAELARLQAAFSQLPGAVSQLTDLTTSFTAQGTVAVTVPIASLNQAVAQDPALAGIRLAVRHGRLTVSDESRGVQAQGTLAAQGPQTVAWTVRGFAVQGVTLAWPPAGTGFPVLTMNLGPVLEGGSLQAVTLGADTVTFTVIPAGGGGFPF